MSDKLNRFLVDLVSDQGRMSRFLAAPHDVVAEADLTDEQKAAVLSRDSRRLAEAMGAGGSNGGNVQQITAGIFGVKIMHGEQMSIGNVQNVTIGNVQNFVASAAMSLTKPVTNTKKPAKTIAKSPGRKPGSRPR
jgi:Aromatic-ring-opening dioxygenase LigAB, LigA subunit